jgi:dCMP deaminase
MTNRPWWLDPEFQEATKPNPTDPATWDHIFMELATSIAKLSKCSSRQIGAVIVSNRRIIATGYNGAPAHSRLCQTKAFCPRRKLNLASGQGLELCPAVHAEANCCCSAARLGIATEGATLYIYGPQPCKSCAGILINAGIIEVVCSQQVAYDPLAAELFKDAGVKIRYV